MAILERSNRVFRALPVLAARRRVTGAWTRQVAIVASASIVAVAAAACSTDGPPPTIRVASATFRTAAGAIRVDRLPVADTETAREHGLMARTSLPPDGGMVFHFPSETDAAFWMKDTPIPLSVAFVAGDRRIVDILDMAPCAGDPCPLYRSAASYRTAIEMHAGWFSAHGIRIGDEVALSYGRG